jgi:hypothetical protein
MEVCDHGASQYSKSGKRSGKPCIHLIVLTVQQHMDYKSANSTLSTFLEAHIFYYSYFHLVNIIPIVWWWCHCHSHIYHSITDSRKWKIWHNIHIKITSIFFEWFSSWKLHTDNDSGVIVPTCICSYVLCKECIKICNIYTLLQDITILHD